ncbi:DUF3618 domain-containing protein [Kitasatospora camelliae]|uniref:DUF3618 domain-containing protein n=1 Tax=Kitasatospora camelliae TaxID=3156397 RepID=A0AAU8KAI1_9ACTN
MRETIEHAREHLGQTMEEVAAKADLKGQVQAKTAHIKEHLHDTAADAAAQAREKAAHVAHTGQAAASQTKDHLTQTTAALAQKVQDRTPEPVRDAAVRTGRVARKPLPWAVAAAAVCVLALVVYQRRTGRQR